MNLKKINQNKFMEIIQKCASNNELAHIFDHVDGSVIKAELEIISVKLDRKEIILRLRSSSIFFLEKMIDGSGELNIYVPGRSIVFSSTLISLDKKTLSVSFPKECKSEDRRENYRFNSFEENIRIGFKIGGKKFQKSCFDMGIKGTSCILSKSEAHRVREDDELSDFTLEYNGKKIEIGAKLKGITRIDPRKDKNYIYEGIRLSISFESIKEKDLLIIENFVKLYKNLS